MASNTAAIQDAAYANAVSTLNTALNYSATALSVVNGTGWITELGVTPPPPVAPGMITNLATANRVRTPTIPGFDGIAVPVKPDIGAFTAPNIGNIPDLVAAEPILNFPPAPSTAMPASPGAAPAFNAPAIPDKPNMTLPDVPTFTPVALPDTPLIEMPYFDMQADFGDLTAPLTNFEYSEKEYQSALLDATKAKLLNDMLNGGYGIDVDDERRLWERARDRELENANARINELSRLHAARGFTLPTGSFFAQQEAAQQEANEKVSSVSRDIAIKRADMFVENRKFTITAATQLEDMLLRHFGFVCERALNAARLQVELGATIFNAQVAKYNAKVQAYQSYAAAYESRIRAALAAVEVFKAQIEGAKLSVEVQKLYTDVYATQVQGATAMANLYKTEMEAAQVAASIEQLKLQAFKAQVETYAEQVRARGTEFDMFKAQIEGEVAKVQAYDATVRAHTARVQGFEAKARVAETVARTEIAQAGAKIDVYKADMDRYRTEVGIATEKIRATLQQFSTQVQEYSAFMDAAKAGADNDTRAHEATSRNYVAYTGVVAERLKAMIDQVVKDMEVRAGVANEASKTAAQLGSAWASAVTGLAAEITSV